MSLCERCDGKGQYDRWIADENEDQKCYPLSCPDCNGTGRVEELDEHELYGGAF